MQELDTWTPLKKFFEEKGLVRQHLDSYNNFIENGLQRVINNHGDKEGGGWIELDIEDFDVKLEDIRVGKPSVREADGSKPNITPNEARLRSLNYSAPLFLKMTPVLEDEERETREVYIGDLPVMVGSDICHLSSMSEEEQKEAGEDPLDRVDISLLTVQKGF